MDMLKIVNHMTQKNSCVIMEQIDHHTQRSTLLGFATRSWVAVLTKPLDLRAQLNCLWQGDFALQTDPVASPFFAQPVDFSGQESRGKRWSCQE